jgi:hypothetical protein
MCPTVARFYIGDHCFRAGYRLPGPRWFNRVKI